MRFRTSIVTAGALIALAVPAAAGAGVVKEKTGGYYDPARSTYVPAAKLSTRSIAGVFRARPGRIVMDATGGYYDPERSTYVIARAA